MKKTLIVSRGKIVGPEPTGLTSKERTVCSAGATVREAIATGKVGVMTTGTSLLVTNGAAVGKAIGAASKESTSTKVNEPATKTTTLCAVTGAKDISAAANTTTATFDIEPTGAVVMDANATAEKAKPISVKELCSHEQAGLAAKETAAVNASVGKATTAAAEEPTIPNTNQRTVK